MMGMLTGPVKSDMVWFLAGVMILMGLASCFLWEVKRGWGECWRGENVARGKVPGRDIFQIVREEKRAAAEAAQIVEEEARLAAEDGRDVDDVGDVGEETRLLAGD